MRERASWRKRLWAAAILGLIAAAAWAQSGSNGLSCRPITSACATYSGCAVTRLATGQTVPFLVSQVGEAACILCDDVVEQLIFFTSVPGWGICSDGFCPGVCSGLGCDPTCARGTNCCTRFDYPPLCDPPHAHGPEQTDEPVSSQAPEVTPRRPPTYTFDRLGQTFLLMEYTGELPLFPTLTEPGDHGLFFVQSPEGMGGLVTTRLELGRSLAKLLRTFAGNRNARVRIDPQVPDISLKRGARRAAPFVSAGRWAVEWRAVVPLTPSIFPHQIYPRLLLDGVPATIDDLRRAGLDPQLMPQ